MKAAKRQFQWSDVDANSSKNAKKQANHSAEIKTGKQQRCQQEKN